jgi:isopenicillin-N N-acyltransferase-like protein
MNVACLETRNRDFSLVEFSGKAHERGFMYGQKFAANITEMLGRSYSFYTGPAKLSKDEVLKIAGKNFPFIQSYSNEIAEELKGMAEGSQTKIDEITLLTSFWDILTQYAFGGERSPCTSLCVTGEATLNRETYLGQNNDGGFVPNLDEYDFLMKTRTDSGIDMLTFTIMGCPAYTGVNSNGIGLCINGLSDGEFKPGVPFSVITRGILGSRSIGDALKAVISADRAGPANYVIADANGQCYDIETTCRNFNLVHVNNSLAHANHYLDRTNVKTDQILKTAPTTVTRCDRMKQLLSSKHGSIDLKTCFEFLSDHLNYPWSICTHPDETLPLEMRMKSMDSFVISPAKREMWITRDNPCKGDYRKYAL